jgi:nicotinate-nucleotide--dimethylbenzimidazole phosphoribosyltransferase
MISGLPFDDIRALLRQLPASDETAASRFAVGAGLGRLDGVPAWLARWSGKRPAVARPVVALFAATHGVSRHLPGVDPLAVLTAQLRDVAAGEDTLSRLCRTADLGLKVLDLALDVPTDDFLAGAALSERDCTATIAFGMEAAAGGADLLCLGTLSAGTLPAATAVLAALLGGSAGDWCDDAATCDVADRGLSLHRSHLGDPLEVVRRVGGREIAALVGAILAARLEKIPVVVEGRSALAAAVAIEALQAGGAGHCLPALAGLPVERRIAERLGVEPLLDLGAVDVDGGGAALAAVMMRTVAGSVG